MNPWNFFAHFLDLSLGGGFRGIKNNARIGWRSQSGGCDSAISRAVIPRDHKSLLLSYVASGFSSQAITSGAIQYGVPMNVFLRPIVLSNWALTPKSTGIEGKIFSTWCTLTSWETKELVNLRKSRWLKLVIDLYCVIKDRYPIWLRRCLWEERFAL